MPRSIDLTLDENELKFLINLMWSTDSYKTKSMAERLNIVDEALEGRLVKCLGYCALQDDWLLNCRLLSKDKLKKTTILDSIVVFQAPMTEIEQSMVDEMSDLIKDQNEKIRKYETYIEELQQQMADMTNRVYDCWEHPDWFSLWLLRCLDKFNTQRK